jgi:hypothetical protein
MADVVKLVIDDLDVASSPGFQRALVKRGLRASPTPYLLIVLYLVQGALQLSEHRSYGWLSLCGAALIAVILFRRHRLASNGNALVIPTEFSASDAGIAYAVRGTSRSIPIAWCAVRSVTNEPDAFVVQLRAAMSRPIYVPKPSDASLANALWMLFYRRLVAPRGLRPTPPDRLAVIANTAAT